MAEPLKSASDSPHDVLAAEEFPLGSADPVLHAEHAIEEPPHDVLAAEEFPVGGPDPVLHAEHFHVQPAGGRHAHAVHIEVDHGQAERPDTTGAASTMLGTPQRARRRIVGAMAFVTAVIVGLAGLRRRRP